jgi:xanthine/CO dehydrogenase XdhC/CoxF family maturation factor
VADDRLTEARAELRALQASWEYAFARGARCGGGYHPSLEPVLDRERDLLAVIQEHKDDPAT